ncbi:MAG: DUF6134 family protein [Rhodospirillales bacterium]|nr:DUF6134 family protein [Rhodospirillales bacterium]
MIRCGALATVFGLGLSLGVTPAAAAAAGIAARVPQGCAISPAADPLSLYGEQIRFDVRRNGSLVGHHTVSFARDGERLTTSTRFEVAVDVLFITAYRYLYASEAAWTGACLEALTATTDDNGKESVVRVSRSGQRLAVSGPGGTATAPLTTLPTEHWAYAVVGHDAVINTITGRVYSGELDNEVWYDAAGRWVKMRFPAKDGSSIEYICVTCGIDRAASRS